jgi:hypothetical protein
LGPPRRSSRGPVCRPNLLLPPYQRLGLLPVYHRLRLRSKRSLPRRAHMRRLHRASLPLPGHCPSSSSCQRRRCFPRWRVSERGHWVLRRCRQPRSATQSAPKASLVRKSSSRQVRFKLNIGCTQVQISSQLSIKWWDALACFAIAERARIRLVSSEFGSRGNAAGRPRQAVSHFKRPEGTMPTEHKRKRRIGAGRGSARACGRLHHNCARSTR